MRDGGKQKPEKKRLSSDRLDSKMSHPYFLLQPDAISSQGLPLKEPIQGPSLGEFPSELKNPRDIASKYLQVADLYLLQGDSEKAHELYREAFYLCKRLNS